MFSRPGITCSDCNGEDFVICYTMKHDGEIIPAYAECKSCGHHTTAFKTKIKQLENDKIKEWADIPSMYGRAGDACRRLFRRAMFEMQDA